MKLHRFKYLLKNGKNPKYKYYINAYTKTYFPHVLLRPWLDAKLKDLDKRDDKDYILSQSVWKDVFILLKTIPAIVGGKGAY